MVFVKVRETYDLHTVKNKMTVIAIHTPRPGILKKNYPGLLMQCKAYRPVSADVRVACASVEALDPLQVGTTTDDIAPEDLFNPILYKAMSNLGMSQLEARINALPGISPTVGTDIYGDTAAVDVDSLSSQSDEFALYYGLLSQAGCWKHANPQAGLEMTNLRPLVYEMVYNLADQNTHGTPSAPNAAMPDADGNTATLYPQSIRGGAKPMPFINTTSYTQLATNLPDTTAESGFPTSEGFPRNSEVQVPHIEVVCGCIIIPPSRLHELYYRMVVEWTIEFSSIRPITEIMSFGGLAAIGVTTHFQNYNYSSTKEAVTGSTDTILDKEACMVSANVDVNQVM